MTKSKLFQYILGILLDVAALSFLIYQLSSEIILENAASKSASTETIQLKEVKDPNLQQVLDIFDNIEKGKTAEALDGCFNLAKQGSVPLKIIEYFADFYEFYYVTQNPETQKNCEVTTETFIKNAHYLKDYFNGTKYQDTWIGFAEIIPHYFIKNYDSKDKNQKAKYELYKTYVNTICEQNQFVSAKGADVICLYVNARYYNTKVRFVYELKTLVGEVEHFQEIYPNQLGENGTLRTQRDYLKAVKDYTITQINAPLRIKPQWNKDFPTYTF